MNILWFTNTPCGATEKINKNATNGGWLISLEEELIKHNKIQLNVCFYSKIKLNPFLFHNVTYYPIYRKNSKSKLLRLFKRVLNKEFNEQKELPLLLKVIEKVQPDIIHIHGTEENFGTIQEHTRIPVVISIQGILSAIYFKYFSGIPYSVSKQYEGVLAKVTFSSIRRLKERMFIKACIERKILFQTKFVIGRTEWDKRITRVLAPSSSYFTVNEILRKSFYNKKWRKEKFSNPLQLVTITSNALFKGIETIIETSDILLKNNLTNFKWIVIGIKETDNVTKIAKKWKHIDYRKMHIELIGIRSAEEIAAILVDSDIFCQVSHIENSPNSLCEAMLIGMPIIATFSGGSPSIINNKIEGLLVQEGEPYSYAGAIVEMANDFTLASQYANTARLRACKRHNKEIIVNDLLAIYSSIINK